MAPQSTAKGGFFCGYVVVAAGFTAMALIWWSTLNFSVFLKPVSADFG